MAVRFLWRHLERIAGQDSSFHTSLSGSIRKLDAISIRQPPIRDNKLIALVSKLLFRLSHRECEINRISA
jgi:hypothetical protein